MEAGAFRQPAPNQRGLVRAIVVQDQMHRQVGGDRDVDRVEELPELDAAMASMELPDDRAGLSSAANNEVVPCRV